MLRTILERRVEYRFAAARQTVGEPEGKTDAAADGETDHRPPRAYPHIAKELAALQKPPTRFDYVSRRRQNVRRQQAAGNRGLPHRDDRGWQQPLRDPAEALVGEKPQVHDCDA